jgi:hypothetical protein
MWTAIALWTLNLAGLAAYIYGATVGISRGIPAWWFVLGLPLAYLAIVFVVTLFYFALSWWFRAERPPDVRLSTAAIARMIWHEFWTLAGSAPRMMLYKLLVSDPPPRPAAAPLLLLHGVLCNAGSGTGSAAFSTRAASDRSTRCRTGRRSHRSTCSPIRSPRKSMRCSPRPAPRR